MFCSGKKYNVIVTCLECHTTVILASDVRREVVVAITRDAGNKYVCKRCRSMMPPGFTPEEMKSEMPLKYFCDIN